MTENKTRTQLADMFIAALEEQTLPWYACWNTARQQNAETGRPYRGVNAMLLSLIAAKYNYTDPRWCTFQQAKKNGWSIIKGSSGVPVEFWSALYIPEHKVMDFREANDMLAAGKAEKEDFRYYSKNFYVFNAAQIDGIPAYTQIRNNVDIDAIRANRDTLIRNMGVQFMTGGSECFYTPSKDMITMPPEEVLKDTYGYMCSFLHEAGHATAHESRLNRPVEKGKEGYAKEELRAEIASAMVSQELGLPMDESRLSEHVNLHKAYIQNWAQAIKDAPQELFAAIKDAEEISDYLVEKGEFHTLEQEVKPETVQTEQQEYEVQVDAVLARTKDFANDRVMLGKTPGNLGRYGFNTQIPLVVRSRKLREINSPPKATGANRHALSVDIIKHLPQAIKDPAIVMISNTHPKDSVVVISDMADDLQQPVIIAIQANAKADVNQVNIEVNSVNSAYGRTKFSDFLLRAYDENRILTVGDKNSHQLFQLPWLQLPSELKTGDYAENIAQFKANVNITLHQTAAAAGPLEQLGKSIPAPAQSEVRRYFIDMDGTLAEFKRCDHLEQLYEPGYFRDLQPQENVVETVRQLVAEPGNDVYVLSAYLSDSSHALIEKNQWLDAHLPEIDAGHRLFVPCGQDKSTAIPGGIRATDTLLDDYTKNLMEWQQAGGRGVKLLNGINHTHGTWQGQKIDKEIASSEMARQLVDASPELAQERLSKPISDNDQGISAVNPNAESLLESQAVPHRLDQPIPRSSWKRGGSRDRGGNGQVVQAIKQQFDVLEYAQRTYGLTFKKVGKDYRCIEHDSMWIDPVKNLWVRHSADAGGSIIDLVAYFEEMSPKEAISKLRREMTGEEFPKYDPSRYAALKAEQEQKGPFQLPEKTPVRFKRVFAYLIKSRGIDADVVGDMVQGKLLYETAARHNACFVAPDYDGKIKGAAERGTTDQRFFHETGEKLGWMVNPHRQTMFIAEAPIDAMSIMSMMKLGGKDYTQYSYYAQCGNPQDGLLKYHIEHNPEVQRIYLCFDNDKAGDVFEKKARAELKECGFSGMVIRHRPKNHDFNDDLKACRSIQPSESKPNNTQEEAKCSNISLSR